MKIKAVLLAAVSAVLLSAPPAHAVGCLSGAAAGAVAGHYAGHHAVLGAIGGCIAGHHIHKVQQQKKMEQKSAPAPDGTTPDAPK